METYFPRALPVEAIQFTRYNVAEIQAAFPNLIITHNDDGSISVRDDGGTWRCNVGSYLVAPKGGGLVTVYQPKQFDATFTRGEQAS